MARPPVPSNVLELRGSFRKHPERRRVDLAGAGEFDPNPPAHLPQELVPAWHYVIKQINPAVLTGSDHCSVECMARLTLQMRLTGDVQVIKELRQWYAQYGMTAVGRGKLPGEKVRAPNPFADL